MIGYSEEIAIVQPVDLMSMGIRLKKWDAEIDPSKLRLLSKEPVTWNNGSLGCAMPGKFYTQALVPGYLILLQHDSLIIEVHTDQMFRSMALPGFGFI